MPTVLDQIVGKVGETATAYFFFTMHYIPSEISSRRFGENRIVQPY
jgi:hypothetical protein